ncbi:TRAP transporter substrate-binding protein [Nonomuraea dietziae]|uniref:TRAP transporter substrate-binding protein n=1 Tax=Nonomuraea dietziae TaxID=65515 RepID=UPI003445F29E
MKRLAMAAAALVLLAGCAAGPGESKSAGSVRAITLRIGTDDKPGRPAAEAIAEFARQVATVSNGALRMDPIWQAAGADIGHWDQEVAKRIVSGDLDMGLIPSRAWDTEGVTSLRVLNTPMLIDSDRLVDEIVAGELAGPLMAGLEQAGVTGLALIPEELRHLYGFGQAILTPGQLAGKQVRAPYSQTAYAAIEALGGKPGDFPGEAFPAGLENGAITAAESSYGLALDLPAKSYATVDLTLYPKINVLVINTDTFRGLSPEQQRALREAARITREKVTRTRTPEDAAAAGFCAAGGNGVKAGPERIKEFERAWQPLVAELGKDSLLTRIKGLKAALPPAPAVTACRPGAVGQWATTDDPAKVNGTYRIELTAEELEGRGMPAGDAANNAGVITMTFKDGRFLQHEEHGRWPDCGGSYALRGSEMRWSQDGGKMCNAITVLVTWKLDGNELTMTPTQATEALDFWKAWFAETWKRVR